jgi:hypothetical protein
MNYKLMKLMKKSENENAMKFSRRVERVRVCLKKEMEIGGIGSGRERGVE